MPVKIGGGGKPQEYDPSNGRYGSGSGGGNSHYYSSALRILDSYPSVNGDKRSSMMPNYRHAMTPETKFVQYSLNPEHPTGKNKARVYQKALGYNLSNYKSLQQKIHVAVVMGKAKLTKISKNEYGVVKFQYEIPVHGPNGRNADVIAIYGIGPESKRPYMITNYVK